MSGPCLRALVVSSVFSISTGLIAQAPAAPNPPRDPVARGACVIRGRVVDVDGGRPLRGVEVTAGGSSTLTDGDGRYQIRDLAGGRYSVTARSDGYLTMEYGQTRPLGGGTPLQLLANALADNVNFSLPRGAAIAGVVRDEVGDPAVGVQVRALRPTYRDGRKTLAVDPGAFVLTNDLGEYRIFGLLPGMYYVAALVAPGPPGENSGAGFAVTYFPGTTNFAEAERVSAKAASGMLNIDFAVRVTPLASISGIVVDEQDRPLTRSQVGFQQVAPGTQLAFSLMPPRPDGTFRISALPPGEYDVTVSTAAMEGASPLQGTERIAVNGADVPNVRLTASRMATAAGRLVVDPSSVGTFPLENVAVRFADPAEPVAYRPRIAGVGAASRIRPDFTFTTPTAQSQAALTLVGMPSGWYLKAVRLDGVDVTDRGMELPRGGSVNGIEIVVSNRDSRVSGVVHGLQHESVNDYTVVIFARDPDRRRGQSRYFATGRPDESGRFVVNGLPVGEYLAAALEYADVEAAADPDFLAPLQPDATAFTLFDGGTVSLDLPLLK